MKTLYIVLFILFIISYPALAQEIEATLGGNTSSEGFSVKDNSSNSLLRVTGAGNVGINNSNPVYKLDVNGDINLTSGNVIRIGNNAIISAIGTNNTFLGINAGYSNTTGWQNLFLGHNAGYNNISGINNTFLGFQSGWSNNTGGSNVCVGYLTGFRNTSGHHNIFVGTNAGEDNTTGYNNIFIGGSTGSQNISGIQNVSIGNSAGGQNTTSHYNTCIGSLSGFNNLGTQNVFIGYVAGFRHSTGDYNVFVGSGAGWGNISGYGNVFIGLGAGYNETGSYKLYIDNSTTSTPLIYGDFSANYVTINGDLNYTGTLTNTSDKRFKKNIVRIANAIEKLQNIKGVYYNWREDEFPEMSFSEGKQIGVIAQDVEKVYPELVRTDENGYKAVDYSKLTVVLIEAVKEQQKIIENQNEIIKDISHRLVKIEKMICNEEMASR